MRVSVAMATFNGAAYLQAQLESISSQTRPPDELVVCDDGSSDQTVEIIEKFSSTVAFPVKIICNPINLGYSANFSKAIRHCDGDVIFISDQDDVWLPEKIATVLPEFYLEERKFWVVINDQIISDNELRTSGDTIFGASRALGFPVSELTAGSCTAISRLFATKIMPSPASVPYDSWIHRVAVAFQCRSVINIPLQYYRRHMDNTSSPLVLKGYRSRLCLMMNEFGLSPMDERHRHEYEFLASIAKVAEVLVNDGIATPSIAYTVREDARKRRELLMTRIEINRLRRMERLLPIMNLRNNTEARYTFLSIFKDIIRMTGNLEILGNE